MFEIEQFAEGMWTLFFHEDEFTCEWIGDFDTYDEACEERYMLEKGYWIGISPLVKD